MRGDVRRMSDIQAAKEQLEILRRIAERGREQSLRYQLIIGYDDGDQSALDLFQHLLDEIQNTKRLLE